MGENGKTPLELRVTYAINRAQKLEHDQMTDVTIPSSGENLPQETGIGKTNLKFYCYLFLSLTLFLIQFSLACLHLGLRKPLDMPQNYRKVDYPPCVVCSLEARLICTVCKTRYCSQYCQSSDWPQHKNHCIPPP